MVDLKDAKNALRRFIAETSFTNIDKITDSVMIFREGIFDSMGLMNLITFLEDNFHIQIKDTDLVEENFESVDAICGFLEKSTNNTHQD